MSTVAIIAAALFGACSFIWNYRLVAEESRLLAWVLASWNAVVDAGVAAFVGLAITT